MKNFFVEELSYGEAKTVKIRGNYLKTLARAVEGNANIANAEVMLMTEDSEESSELRLLYAEYGSMSEYVFFNMDYLRNTPEILDVITFNYVRDEILKTGVIIVEKVTATTETDLSKAFKWRHGRTGIVSRFCHFFYFKSSASMRYLINKFENKAKIIKNITRLELDLFYVLLRL